MEQFLFKRGYTGAQHKLNRCLSFGGRYTHNALSVPEITYAYLFAREMLREYDNIKHEIFDWEKTRDDWRMVSLVLYKMKKERIEDSKKNWY